MLAGVGVTYFLIEEIASIIDIEIDHNYLFWVAAGTIADNVPLVGINRILVKEVINNWFSFDDHIIKNLSDYFNSSLKFQNRMKFLRFVNRLLANGRLPNGKNLALEYMLTGEEKAKNEIRTELFSGMFAFEEQLFQIKDFAMQVEIKPHQKSLIYFDKEDNLPAEFLGFAASVICNKYLIPVIIIKRKNGILKAEARSIEGTDLVECLLTAAKLSYNMADIKRQPALLLKNVIWNYSRSYFKNT